MDSTPTTNSPATPSDPFPALPSSPETPDEVGREPAFVVPPGPPIRRRRRWRPIVVPIAVFLVAVLGGGALFLGGFALGSQRATTAGTAADLQQEFAPFWEAWDAITQQYALGPVDRHALIEGAIGGLFKAVDDP